MPRIWTPPARAGAANARENKSVTGRAAREAFMGDLLLS
jgi:hypothetical protein